jgi:hypothetical protein
MTTTRTIAPGRVGEPAVVSLQDLHARRVSHAFPANAASEVEGTQR